MPKVPIIILTYNSSNYIVHLLKSINSLKEDAEIIVVDNASEDDTLDLVESSELKVHKVLKLAKNLGFAAGINAGARSSSGQYLLFINPDTKYTKGSLDSMLSVFDKNEDIGIVGGKLTTSNGKAEKSAGKFFNFWQTLFLILGLDEVLGVRYSPEKQQKVDFVSGGLMMVRSSVFKKLAGFDENFFMYVEDMEFCFRAKKAGFETWFNPELEFAHVGQGSSNRAFAIKNIYVGILYFYKKHKNKFELEVIRLALKLKAYAIYTIGRLTNNSYYIETYRQALECTK